MLKILSEEANNENGSDGATKGHIDPYNALGLDNQLPETECEYGTSADPMNPYAKNDGSSEER